ncbi:beta-1,3-galactosyltransferase 5-like isoform X2 [Portunus trituberculatus]|uniref:beta-1,3-galactosyltransferase 5-like isoform X2 n=1 Tax=Portunus trituberculatus TaxID=210409 RepID=UPI001E1CEEAC|nr:beta-1,3-galactosyltransferase 5-like isoform X2 [Portunus trituberculatus]XP_045109118.1 beta-1,3-galactosyltransferase 5-like isoform X2 [Portunus trituberculatus]
MEGRKHGHHATLWQDTALLTATLRKHCDILKTSGYKVWRIRLFSPGWVAITALAFFLTYFFLPRPVHVIQLEWPWSTDAVGLDGAAYDESLLEAALQNGQENWTHPAGSLSFPGNSHDASHHPHRFKFIFSRKRLNLERRPKVNFIPEQVQWRHDPDHLCRTADPPPLAVALVVSAVPHDGRRTFIRDTWARAAWYPHTLLKTVFVVGATQDEAQQQKLDEEIRTHGDIIQYNFIDSYANLTYKTLSLLSWGVTRCSEVQFLAKIDDDVLVNPFHLKVFVQDTLQHPPAPKGILPNDELFQAPPNTNPAVKHIYGRYDAQPYPLRTTKWALSLDEYPEKVFPPFVHGPAYLVGMAAARELLRVAPYVPLVKLEDVYTTGLVAHAAGLRHVQIFGHVSTFKTGLNLYSGTQAILEETGPKGREAAWEEILKFAPKV